MSDRHVEMERVSAVRWGLNLNGLSEYYCRAKNWWCRRKQITETRSQSAPCIYYLCKVQIENTENNAQRMTAKCKRNGNNEAPSRKWNYYCLWIALKRTCDRSNSFDIIWLRTQRIYRYLRCVQPTDLTLLCSCLALQTLLFFINVDVLRLIYL